ncbi:hypothetical protein PV382_18090 [Streptomyces scabiei]|uniref:hypothetical protein n=1 Tax=Streptomyces scabiei TaxID=1930 RepID=UPI0029B98677|nr:hypothetical protein [Streptomyces scabiei]MDX3174188.1 hypothetical protein [Streptomyces scabiei]
MTAAKKKPSSLADNPPLELYGPEDGGWYTTRVYDWIPLCPCLRDADVRGYLVLRSLVIEKYKNPVRKLTLLDLCELIPSPTPGQPSSLTRVRSVLDGLSKAGLVSTPEGGPVKTSSRASAAGKPIRIRVNDMPQEGYSGWRNTEDKLQHVMQLREAGRISDPGADESGPGRKSDPPGRKSDPGGQKSDPDPGDDLPEPELPLDSSFGTTTDGTVPSARSAVGVRSTSSSGSSEAGGGSGSAAAAKDSSSSGEEDGQAGLPGQRQADAPELSREQLAAVRAVEAVLPPMLLEKLPYGQFPGRNRPAVLDALESRTVAQIRERVSRRWVAYGYEPALYDGAITNPVGAALELISPNRYCPDLSCEDGAMIDHGGDCRACLERRVSRRDARAAGQLENSGSKRTGTGRAPECVICRDPFRGDVPAGSECLGCQREAAAAFQALSARLGPPDTEWVDLDVPVDEESPEPSRDDPEADHETDRLRAFYARQFGTRDQVEAYCTEAPF